LPDTKNIGRNAMPTYAVPSDFCRLFAEEMNGLYRLAFVLTADRSMAEQSFASALKDCLKANGVFKNWAGTWARRAIVQNAILATHVTAAESSRPATASADIAAAGLDASLAAVIGLGTFERFVFVLSVLESYSDQECRVLLQCTRRDVVEARTRALEHIGKSKDVQPPAPESHLAATVQTNTVNFIPPGKFETTVEFRGARSTQG
jgi:hypothetical protein